MEDFSKYNNDKTTLRKAQLLMLDMLAEVDKTCRNYNLPYWLDGGSLLGAVRHKGFIPWDDDLDIALMYDDYLKLLAILPKELPETMILQTGRTRYYGSHISKVRYVNSFMDADAAVSVKLEHKGVFVDIFPVERMYMFPKRVVDVFYCPAFLTFKIANPLSSVSSFFKYGWALFILPFCFLAIGILRVFYRLWKTNKMAYAYGINFHRHRRYNEIFPLKTIEFEGRQLPCPNDTDAFLRGLYGNYMQVPPPDKRITHAQNIKIW
ncbi:MAG: LicD family protein [Prevotellaceae bacterium]|jgi:lipopolysaccharide cholinephosphotransferase|nr:LicD family protein [Prevotellaceae bacterium]